MWLAQIQLGGYESRKAAVYICGFMVSLTHNLTPYPQETDNLRDDKEYLSWYLQINCTVYCNLSLLIGCTNAAKL